MGIRKLIIGFALLMPTPAFADFAECVAFDDVSQPSAVLLSHPFTSPQGSSTRSNALEAIEIVWWRWVKEHRNSQIRTVDAQCRNFATEASRAEHRQYFLSGKSVYEKVIEIDWKPTP
jgi:hypothetical protein